MTGWITPIRTNLIAWLVPTVLTLLGTVALVSYDYLKITVVELQLQSARQHKSEGFRLFLRGETSLAHAHYGQAAAVFKPLADWGIREAQFELGKLLCVGWGVAKNRTLALEYLRQAQLSDDQRLRLAGIRDLAECLPKAADA